jgi:peptide subunit release factor 1 (eRF1)
MLTTKCLGIWMDHANANIIEFADGPLETNIIQSQFTHEVKEDVLGRSEYGMHKKEQHQQSNFYKKIGDVIRNYTDVILFGPTKAKTELFNMLRADHILKKLRSLFYRQIKCLLTSNMPLSGIILQKRSFDSNFRNTESRNDSTN